MITLKCKNVMKWKNSGGCEEIIVLYKHGGSSMTAKVEDANGGVPNEGW